MFVQGDDGQDVKKRQRNVVVLCVADRLKPKSDSGVHVELQLRKEAMQLFYLSATQIPHVLCRATFAVIFG